MQTDLSPLPLTSDLILLARGGSIPFLNDTLFTYLNIPILNVQFSEILNFLDIVYEYGKKYPHKSFLSDYFKLNFPVLGFTDYIDDFGTNEDNIYFVKSTTGKIKVNIDEYLKVINILKPNYFICPFEYINETVGKKRIVRCNKKLKIFYEKFLNLYGNNKENYKIIFPLFLEHNNFMNKNDLDYYILNSNGVLIFTEEYSNLSYKKINEYKNFISSLKLNKEFKIIKSSTNNIFDLFIGNLLGCTDFEVNFPVLLSEKGIVLNINFNDFDNKKDYGDIEKINNFNYKQKFLDINECENDLGILEKNCECFVCKTGYSRAYIQHLYKCKELNGNILTIIHNLYQTKQLHKILKESDEKTKNNFILWFLNNYCEK